MKLIRKILLAILAIVVVLALFFTAYAYYQKPDYEGGKSLKNIDAETTVYFDEYGVPHIYAQSQKDAMTALGFVHAQDRLWQMELMRRIAPGRLSEIFGTKALNNDKFFAGIGIEEASEKAVAQLDKNSEVYKLSMAYLDGINQYLDEGKTPIEFLLVGVKKQKFTLVDVYNIFGYMSFSFAMAHKSDPLLTSLRDKLGMDYLNDLGVGGSFNTTKIPISKKVEYTEISKSVAVLLENSPIPPFIGSNSWVIGPQKTKNGKVIFANDPHIGFSQPGTWYEAHLVSPDYEIYGFYLAGTPFPLLGHNREYAYGLTMFENDDIDFFSEQENPSNNNQYKTVDGWKKYSVRTKTIKVKDSSDVVLKIRESQHGPIMNDFVEQLKDKQPAAMSWVYTKEKLQVLQAVYGLSHAKGIDDFHKNVGLIAAPGLNVMYGDAKGNIGWFTSGKLYKMPKSVNPNFILDGTNGIDDKKEFLDFSKNPSAQNPDWHYVYSANNQPEAIDSYEYPGYYLPEDRGKRIDRLLKNDSNWDKNSVGKMINDNTSTVALEIVNVLENEIANDLGGNEKNAFTELTKWKGSHGYNDVAPTIYNRFLFHFMNNTFEDEMGEENYKIFLTTHLMKQVIAPTVKNEKSLWWDDISTKPKENRNVILLKSFTQAVADLESQLGNDISKWNWQRVHSVEHQHAFGSVILLKPFFNVGPFPIDGSNEVINNLFFEISENGEYKVKGGPSTRRIIDFSDIENSWSVLPTGQSGNFMSPHYDDQAELYNFGKFRKMKLNKNEIISTSTKLVFKPKL